MRALIKHPYVIMLPIIMLLVAGWNYYLHHAAVTATSSPNYNLLIGGDFGTLADGLPHSWQLRTNSSSATAQSAPGRLGGHASAIKVSNYRGGAVDTLAPIVSLRPNTKYLFKGYYRGDVGFELLVKYYRRDGSSTLTVVRSYPKSSDQWTTASVGFDSQDNIDAAQIFYRITGAGTLQLDDTYLTAINDIFIAPPVTGKQNLIPNPNLTISDSPDPSPWTSHAHGDNSAHFAYGSEPRRNYLRVDMTNYKNGEARWQYPALDVSAGQRFWFQLGYKASVPVPIVAEYQMEDGTTKFQTVADLEPADEWTQRSVDFEVPAGAKTLFVSASLQRNGSIETSNYDLRDITKTGPRQFHDPLVSITMDDGLYSTYQQGVPILGEFNFPGTFYINPITPTDSEFMSVSQMRRVRQLGHEIGSHSYQHLDLTTISRVELEKQLQKPLPFFDNNAHVNVTDFAPPYGRDDAEVQWFARKYYQSLRGTMSGVNTRQNLNPYNLLTLYVNKDTPVATLQSALQEARATHGWLILVYHGMMDDPRDSITLDPSSFRRQMQQVKQSGIQVVTVSDGLKKLMPQAKDYR